MSIRQRLVPDPAQVTVTGVQPTIDESLFKRNKVTPLAADVGR